MHLKDLPALQADLKTVFTLDDPMDSPQKGYERFAEFLNRWSNKYNAFAYQNTNLDICFTLPTWPSIAISVQ